MSTSAGGACHLARVGLAAHLEELDHEVTPGIRTQPRSLGGGSTPCPEADGVEEGPKIGRKIGVGRQETGVIHSQPGEEVEGGNGS